MQEAERMRVYDQIDELLTKCRRCPKHNPRGYYLHECRGCPVLEQLQALGKQLYQKKPRKQEERIRSILEKGQDMTLSEVKFLIENGVTKKRIIQALKIDPNAFYHMLERIKERWWNRESFETF